MAKPNEAPSIPDAAAVFLVEVFNVPAVLVYSDALELASVIR